MNHLAFLFVRHNFPEFLLWHNLFPLLARPIPRLPFWTWIAIALVSCPKTFLSRRLVPLNRHIGVSKPHPDHVPLVVLDEDGELLPFARSPHG
jgi:hypothetical protein